MWNTRHIGVTRTGGNAEHAGQAGERGACPPARGRPRPLGMASALSTPSVRVALGGGLSLAIAVGIGRFVYTPILPAMVEGLGLDQAEAGLLASSNFVGYLLGAIVLSLPSLPGSRRFWMLSGLVLSVATTALSGMGSTMPTLLAIRFGSGLAGGLAFVPTVAVVFDLLARSGQGRLSGLLFAGPALGIMVSSLLVAWLDWAGFGWRSSWYACAALCAVLLVVVVRLIPPASISAAPPAGPEPRPSIGSRAGSGPLVRTVLSYGLFGFGYVITATFIVAMTRSEPRLAPFEHAIWPIVGLAALPSVTIWNAFAGRFNASRAYGAACLVMAAGVAASVLSPTPAGILFAAICLGGTFIGVTALGLVVAKRTSGSDSRRLVGLMTVAFGLGQIVGPTFAGALHSWTGSFLLPSAAAAVALLACAALVWTVPRTVPA